jgi:hypothetical protein
MEEERQAPVPPLFLVPNGNYIPFEHFLAV